MPPKRSQGRQAARNDAAAPTDSLIWVDDIPSRVAQAAGTWESGGQDTLLNVLKSHVEPHTSALGNVALAHALRCSLNAELSAEALHLVLTRLVNSFSDDAKEDHVFHLGETLVEIVQVLEDEREAIQDLRPKAAAEDMEVDGEKKAPSVTQKGVQVIKLLVESGHLPSHIPNLLLSPDNADIMVQLGLHPIAHAPQLLHRAMVKRNTALFYKQSKFNLLRESSEGFSGLIVLLTGPDALASDTTDEQRNERAKRVWGKVMSLIGYFNLSPPRVLDIILEIMSCHVAEHWRFFMGLLRCSPWGTGAIGPEGKGKGKEKAVQSDWATQELDSIAESLEAQGDRVLAQVLGVKFGFYQRQDGGETPIGLAVVAALLIKHRFVAMSDLLPFLSPDDAQMEDIRKKWLASISSRSGPSNALSNSVLLDDDAPASSSSQAADTSGPPPKPPPEQRIQLLQALLLVGDIPSSLFFLAQYPWLAQSHPAIADLILRLVSHALEPVYRAVVRLQLGELEEGELEYDASAPTYRRKQQDALSTLLVPTPPPTSTTIFEFFYPDWAEELEQWQDIDDIHQRGLRWLGLVRGMGARTVETMVKLCRIGAHHFATLRKAKEAAQALGHAPRTTHELRLLEPTASEMDPWLHVIRASLLPALSAGGATAAFDIELWHLLKHFPYPVRYQLYGEWRDSTCSFKGRNCCPIASNAAAECTREIKKALSRVTASQSAPSGGTSGAAAQEKGPARVLAKLSHSNPCALWTTAVTQVKAYSNIGQFIVEAGRYMTQLAMDVATFTLVDTLSDDMVPRMDVTGTNVAQWLESLSTFVGDFNRRYAQMDLEPVLQFIINRLMRGDSADLIVLTQLIGRMQGITLVENHAISDAQLEAYATGREMIREAFFATTLSIARPSDDPTQKPKDGPVDKAKSTKKSLPRLINALRDTSLAVPLWIALAQTRQGAVGKLSSAPLKAMSKIQDNCHEAFIQYGDLVSEHMTADEHIGLTPDFADLVNDFGLDYSMAFQLLRPKLNALMIRAKNQDKESVQRRLQAEKLALNLKISSPTTPLTALPGEESPRSPSSPQSPSMDIDALEPASPGATAVSDKPALNGVKEEDVMVPAPRAVSQYDLRPSKDDADGKKHRSRAWQPSALVPTMHQAKAFLPQSVNDVLSAPFFVIFWHLATSDITFSADTYQKAIDRITAIDKDISTWRTTAVSEAKAERLRLKAQIDTLSAERDVQQALVNGPIRRRLRSESSKWFGKAIVEKNLQKLLSIQLHQYCFYPRALLTPSDAVFVAKFIRLAHDLGTVGFSTVFAYSNFFNDQLAACIFSCTESEARNLGRCLRRILADLDAWHADEATYKREALGQTDKQSEDKPSKTLPGMLYKGRQGEDLKLLPWNSFRNLYAKFHSALCHALVSCWTETDYMHMHNATTVALQVLPSFPMVDRHGKSVENAVADLLAEKNGPITPDMKLSTGSYLRSLKTRKNNKPYVQPAKFSPSGAKLAPPSTANGKGRSPSTPAPGTPSASRKAESAAASPAPAAPDTADPAAPSAPSTAISTSDPKELRRKLEEARAKGPAGKIKEERSGSAPPAVVTERPPTPPPAGETKESTDSPAPPAAPRVTRSASTQPTAPVAPLAPYANGADNRASPAVSAGPTKHALPPRPGQNGAASTPIAGSMAPPTSLTVDEERAAARARKFGTLSQTTSPAKAPPAGPAAGVPAATPTTTPVARDRRERSRPASPTAPPAPSSRRSPSAESKVSERSRRERREREDRDRQRPPSGPGQRRSETPADRAAHVPDEARDKKRQEELLQGRADRLASEDRGARRSSRDDKDREDRRTRDKERERERDKGRDGHRERDRERERERERDADSHKRKRDDDPRRDRRDERDRDRERDRRDRDRDGRDGRDGHRDRERERDRDRDRRRDDPPRRPGDRDDRDTRRRDEREPTRERDRPQRMSPMRESRPARNGAPVPQERDRTPKRDSTPKASAPPPAQIKNGPSANGDRIVEPPRTRGAPDVNLKGHASLPPRPGATAPASTAPGSLASRIAPVSSGQAEPPRSNEPPKETNGRSTRSGEPKSDTPQDGTPSSEQRKRPLEESAPVREESPGTAKRVKIDRDRARRGREGGSRMLADAMKAANDK